MGGQFGLTVDFSENQQSSLVALQLIPAMSLLKFIAIPIVLVVLIIVAGLILKSKLAAKKDLAAAPVPWVPNMAMSGVAVVPPVAVGPKKQYYASDVERGQSLVSY